MRVGRSAWVVALCVLAGIGACKKPETDIERLDKTCAKVLALQGGPVTPARKDQCLFELGSLGPNMRVCADDCLAKATTEDAFKSCLETVCKGAKP